MGADFSRVRLQPLRDYAGVELQQGRVLLDADANELVGIVDRRLRALASDTLGRAMVSSTTPDAFKITAAGGSLQIAKGRLYVDGLLAENHGALSADPAKFVFDPLLAESQFADPVPYTAQPYFPNPPSLPEAGRHLVFLDVWDREVTPLEQPDLVESALGVDATTRVQTVWQVRVVADDAGAGTTCATADADVPGWSDVIAPSTGVLTTGTFDVAPVDDPCELPPTGGYRGLENQLYRVEIHDPGQPGTGATFKWSRENASVGSRVASMISATELELATLGRDDVLRFNTGDWVEITDDQREFSRAAGEIRKITVIEATRHIQFTPALPAAMLPANFPNSDFPGKQNLCVRRWDQKGLVFRTDPSGTPVQVEDLDVAGGTGVIAVPAAGTTLLLEDGVTVSFDATGAPGFRAGDYWVFAARTSDASVEPLDRAPPRGVHHHFARLGIWDVAAGTVSDCRNPWPPQATGHDCSCTACVTAESHAKQTFTIQDAVNQVRETGGTVCLGPGEYALREPVQLLQARSVRIRGQGPSTVVAADGGAFTLQDCVAVAIENLTVVSKGRQSAVTVHTAIGLSLQQLIVAVLGSDTKAAAISLAGIVAAATIRANALLARSGILANDPSAVPLIKENEATSYLLTAALAIEDNLLWCASQAVVLDGAVLHLMSTRVSGNEILGCGTIGISALGLALPGASMAMRRNSLGVTGSGIRAGTDGLWIEDNKITNSASTAAAVGIALLPGLAANQLEQCQILANQVSGFGSAGIAVGATVLDLIVKLNIIASCGNGIVWSERGNTASATVENNRLSDIGPAGEGNPDMTIGIGVTRARAATIAGNTIRRLGVNAARSTLRSAILTYGVVRPQVAGNDIADIGPPGDFVGAAAGIMLRAPYAALEINHNQVERDATPSTKASSSNWSALVAADLDVESLVTRLGSLTAVRVDKSRILVLNGASGYVWTAPGDTPEPSRGAVRGNLLTARGAAPAVDIVVPGECLFNDNRVETILDRSKITIRVSTGTAIVNANRVRGSEVSIELVGTKTAAVLGNITSGEIVMPGGLGAPWNALNLRG
jgi:hypothetical protein